MRYAAGIPDFPQAVKDFDVSAYLISLGYTLGKKHAIDLYWHPPGYNAATGTIIRPAA